MNQSPVSPPIATKQQDFVIQDYENIAVVAKKIIADESEHALGFDEKTEHVPLAPDIIGHIGFFPMTNSLLFALLVTVFLSLFAFLCSKKISAVPGKLQAFIEILFEYVFSLGEDLAQSRNKFFFPWVMTFFLYIMAANLVALFPGVSTIGMYTMKEGQQEFIPLLRSINSDLNMTLSLALLSVVVTHMFSLKFLGIKGYLNKWFSVKMFGIFLFVGMLELASEFTKVASLSFRLFGNIFAGKVLIKTAGSFSGFILPLPFYFLELIVSIVQASVFMMLTLVFMAMLTDKNHD